MTIHKVTAFITRERPEGRQILLFQHPQAGVQIPAGTVDEGEDWQTAVIREATEETGLTQLTIHRYLGQIENELAAGEAILNQDSHIFSQPDASSLPFAPLMSRGMTFEVGEQVGSFHHTIYTEYDQLPNPTQITLHIDGWLPEVPANVQLIGFQEHEGSYLVGMMAAMASKTGTVGFIGGMDIPLIRKFACGYAEGVKAANPDATIVANMTGTTPTAWNDPVKGAELAKAQKSQGADVIYAAAGGTGIGVLQAAADEGILSIGVDSNQNYLHPGQVLTSMMKRVDNAVYDAFKEGPDMTTGINVMDLKAGGVDVALDDNNKDLVTPEMKAAVDEAKAKIEAGEITVHDYMSDETCPALTF